MKIIKKRNQIYAMGTQKTKAESLDEAEKFITDKFFGSGFMYVNHPSGTERFIIFGLEIKHGGEMITVPIRIDIPFIYLKLANNRERYLENESYRTLILQLKARLTLMETGGSKKRVFLPDIVDKNYKRLDISDQLLLPEHVKD